VLFLNLETAKRLLKYRKLHNLSQEKLAELALVSTKHITKIETCRVTPSIFLIYKIAQAMNISIDVLVKKDET